jgi:hypothetical protein
VVEEITDHGTGILTAGRAPTGSAAMDPKIPGDPMQEFFDVEFLPVK